jgi:hypothetical protein
MNDLGIVGIVASCCIVLIMFFGSAIDALTPAKPRLVDCSVTIENMARKLNVTLLDQCEVSW